MRPRHALLILALAFAVAGAGLQQWPDRSAPPKPGPPPVLKLPPIQEHKLANGLRVWLVEHHEVPVVQVSLVIRAGSAADPAERFGAASLTAAMLDEGAGGRDALALADAFERLGASLSTASSFDASAVRLWTPVARLDEALPLMADVVLRPDFPVKELERLRKERLVSLLQARDDPAALIGQVFPRLLYGATHRYGTPEIGTPDALKAMTVEDLRRFYEAWYRPANAVLIVVGDVTPTPVLERLERAFGSWTAPAPAAAAPTPPGAPQPKAREIVIVDKPGAAQSQIRIGRIGVPRSTPDYFAIEVMNTILGGSLTSRLNQNLREEHGYAYGAGSVFQMRRGAGPFFATSGVQTDKTAEALTEFFKELAGMLAPVPDEELDKARNYLALGFPAGFETAGDLARELETLFVYELPRTYFDTWVPQIRAVTAADVRRVAETYIRPAACLVVIVGDRQAIEGPVRALKLGPVRVVSAEDVLGKM